MAYLIKTVETWRASSEAEAKKLIEEAKSDGHFTLTKYLAEDRNLKQKGEIVEEWKRVTLTKEFNSEKEPFVDVEVEYTTSGGGWNSDED